MFLLRLGRADRFVLDSKGVLDTFKIKLDRTQGHPAILKRPEVDAMCRNKFVAVAISSASVPNPNTAQEFNREHQLFDENGDLEHEA